MRDIEFTSKYDDIIDIINYGPDTDASKINEISIAEECKCKNIEYSSIDKNTVQINWTTSNSNVWNIDKIMTVVVEICRYMNYQINKNNVEDPINLIIYINDFEKKHQETFRYEFISE